LTQLIEPKDQAVPDGWAVLTFLPASLTGLTKENIEHPASREAQRIPTEVSVSFRYDMD